MGFKNEKGQAMVEFALVLPVLLLILGGIIDFGWIFYHQVMINNAAREGARYAAVNEGEVSETYINGRLPDTFIIDSIVVDKSGMVDVDVTIIGDVEILTPLTMIFTDSIELEAYSIMKIE